MSDSKVLEPFATILSTVLHSNVMSMGWRHELAEWERKGKNEILIKTQWAEAALENSMPVEIFTSLSGYNVGTEEKMREWLCYTFEQYYGRPPEPRDYKKTEGLL